jgi:hypothetical protein
MGKFWKMAILKKGNGKYRIDPSGTNAVEMRTALAWVTIMMSLCSRHYELLFQNYEFRDYKNI